MNSLSPHTLPRPVLALLLLPSGLMLLLSGLVLLLTALLWADAALAAKPPPQQKSAASGAKAPKTDAIARGEYVFRATGGCGCHTDTKRNGPLLAGGRPIPTPFGTFYSTNITPHPEAGLGKWREADFIKAMRQGIGPDGQHYFPVFPYTSFTRISGRDLRDLWAYLRSVQPQPRRNTPHDLRFPFGWRFGARVWQWINFSPAAFKAHPQQSVLWNRGAYLATALGHCGECHTPRNLLGALKSSMKFAGSADGPEGELAANITPHAATGIGKWSETDLTYLLETGFKPDGDDVQGLMGTMIENGYQHLSASDRQALAVYVFSLPPIENALVKRPK